MKKQNVRTLALIVSTFTYLLVGAALFDALESPNELQERQNLSAIEDSVRVKYNISDEDYEELRKTIIRSRPYKSGIQWKFAGSFYFALSVITTIGYGHSTPRTRNGKALCIFYALIGIPLNIVMFQSIGERFNMGLTLIFTRLKKCVNARAEVSQTELTLLGSTLCVCVLLGGAAAFHYFEDWEFFNALYFCFITMSTIGFGDFVALQNESMLALQTRPEYVAFSILYILFGLTVFAAALNLMVLKLLTMNTEDERKDELEALAVAAGTPKLDGDVIRLNGNRTHFEESPDTEGLVYNINETSHKAKTKKYNSLCFSTRKKRKKSAKIKIVEPNRLPNTKPRYTVKRMPTNISHLISMQGSEQLLNQESYYNESSNLDSPVYHQANGGHTIHHDHSSDDEIELLRSHSRQSADSATSPDHLSLEISATVGRSRHRCSSC